MHGLRQLPKEVLGGLHHPVVVLVGDVQLHDGELGVVRPVHPFVAEVSAELVHPVEPAHDQPLQVKLVGNPQVERDVQGVVVGDERPRRRATGDALKHRGVHFHPSFGVERFTDFSNDGGTRFEGLFHLRVDDQIHVAHPVPQLGVGEGVVHVAVFVGLHGGQGPDGLAQHRQRRDLHRRLSDLGLERLAFHADEIPAVQELLEHVVVQPLVLSGTQLISVEVNLKRTFVVLQFGKRSLAHDATAHHPSCEFDLQALLEVGFQGCTVVGDGKCRRRIGVDATLTKRLHRGDALPFLFATNHVFKCTDLGGAKWRFHALGLAPNAPENPGL